VEAPSYRTSRQIAVLRGVMPCSWQVPVCCCAW